MVLVFKKKADTESQNSKHSSGTLIPQHCACKSPDKHFTVKSSKSHWIIQPHSGLQRSAPMHHESLLPTHFIHFR